MAQIHQMFSEQITPESVAGRFIFFYPQTDEEAGKILAACAQAGFKSKYQDPPVPSLCRKKGIGLLNGAYFADPNSDYTSAAMGNWRATLEHFSGKYVSPEQIFLTGQFKELGDRLTRIEDRLVRLEDHLAPKKLDKGVTLPSKAAGGG